MKILSNHSYIFKALSLTMVATLFSCHYATAQRHTIYSDRIATLQVVAGDNWLVPPIIELNGHNAINISFDDLTHEYHRYTYSITHCEHDWSTSEGLFTSDYISGFQNGETIDDYEESINTNQLYNHYSLRIPNEKCRLRMSGNYRVDVIDDDTRDTMFTARFMVVEPLVSTSLLVQTNTDIDVRKSHQQLEVRIDYPSTLRVVSPREQFFVKAMQNGRIDNMVTLPPAPQLLNGSMIWTHCRQLIFPAGNEYHKFEFFDPHRNSLNVEQVIWDKESECYDVHLYHDYKRPSYVYDEDANGAFYVRNSDNIENNTTTDYVYVHFYLDTPPFDGNIYINGVWTLNRLTEQYRMDYVPEMKCYHIALPLKYGYYSYQYLFVPNGKGNVNGYGNKPGEAITCPTEGDFFETENQYTILTYYRGQMDRADRLVGSITK